MAFSTWYQASLTWASHGAMAGLSLPMIGAVLGHQHQATTQRYAHLVSDPVQEASEQVAERLRQALGQG